MDEFDTQEIQYEYELITPTKKDDNSNGIMTSSAVDSAGMSAPINPHKKPLFKRYALCNKEKIVSLLNEGDEAEIQNI